MRCRLVPDDGTLSRRLHLHCAQRLRAAAAVEGDAGTVCHKLKVDCVGHADGVRLDPLMRRTCQRCQLQHAQRHAREVDSCALHAADRRVRLLLCEKADAALCVACRRRRAARRGHTKRIAAAVSDVREQRRIVGESHMPTLDGMSTRVAIDVYHERIARRRVNRRHRQCGKHTAARRDARGGRAPRCCVVAERRRAPCGRRWDVPARWGHHSQVAERQRHDRLPRHRGHPELHRRVATTRTKPMCRDVGTAVVEVLLR